MPEALTLPGLEPPPPHRRAPSSAAGAPTLYVDELRAHGLNAGDTAQARSLSRRNGGLWCHLMIGREESLEELHAFAKRLGLRRERFQPGRAGHTDHPHYDLTPKRRAAAVRLGAREVSGEEQMTLCHRRHAAP